MSGGLCMRLLAMGSDGEAPVTEVETGVRSLLTRLDEYGEFLRTPAQLGALIFFAVLLLLWLGSGALSSTLAERRRRGPYLHFLGGLLFPGIYPLVIVALGQATRPVKADSGEAPLSSVRLDGPPPVGTVDSQPQAARGGQAPVPVGGVTGGLLGQAYFAKIRFDDAGRPRGPFNFVVDGAPLRVERIVDVMPEVAVIETLNADGKLQTLRVPYGKIESCTEI